MPEDFLKNAEKIRKQLMDISSNLVEPKSSKYNSKLIVSSCGICGYIPNGGIPLDTHHIVYQQNQDENGFVISCLLRKTRRNHSREKQVGRDMECYYVGKMVA